MLEPFRPARALMTGFVLWVGTALAAEKLPMVAVMPLAWQGVDSTSAMVVTDALADELLRTGAVRVMERSQMEKILKEQGFQKSGACSGSECAVEIGKLLSIDRVVVGTIGRLGSSYTISARAVNVGSGEIVGSTRGQIKGEIDDVPASLLPGISRDLAEALRSRPASPSTVSVPPSPASAPAESTVPIDFSNGTFQDLRDGKTYRFAEIGQRLWMAQGLDFEAPGSICAEDDESRCRTDGRLYNFDAAQSSCPSGWHVPSFEDWSDLIDRAGGKALAGKALKAKSGWGRAGFFGTVSGDGNDTLGFHARPTGIHSGNELQRLDDDAFLWTDAKYFVYKIRDARSPVTKELRARFDLAGVRCVTRHPFRN